MGTFLGARHFHPAHQAVDSRPLSCEVAAESDESVHAHNNATGNSQCGGGGGANGEHEDKILNADRSCND
jgi:hypothetical protein